LIDIGPTVQLAVVGYTCMFSTTKKKCRGKIFDLSQRGNGVKTCDINT